MNYYKCAVWTGDEYDTFFFQSNAALKTKAIYDEVHKHIKTRYGKVERIIYVGKA